jgi:hypothetical protein
MLLLDLALSGDLGSSQIKFRPDQHGKACPIEPRHQRHACTERSVGFVKVCEARSKALQFLDERN